MSEVRHRRLPIRSPARRVELRFGPHSKAKPVARLAATTSGTTRPAHPDSNDPTADGRATVESATTHPRQPNHHVPGLASREQPVDATDEEAPDRRSRPASANGQSSGSSRDSRGADLRRGSRRPSSRPSLGEILPTAAGMVLMGTYFVWVCLQMARHAQGGTRLVVGLFAGAAAGILALAAGFLWKR